MHKFKGVWISHISFILYHRLHTQPRLLCCYCNQCIKIRIITTTRTFTQPFTVYEKPSYALSNRAIASTKRCAAIPTRETESQKSWDLLHVKELLANWDELLTPNLGLFLLNCRGFHVSHPSKQNRNRTKPRCMDPWIVSPGPGCNLVTSPNIYKWGERGRQWWL